MRKEASWREPGYGKKGRKKAGDGGRRMEGREEGGELAEAWA
jgi:hypothetical protein